LERVVARALHGGQPQPKLVLQLTPSAQALLQAANALFQQPSGVDGERLARSVIEFAQVEPQGLAEAVAEFLRQPLLHDRSLWRGRHLRLHQLRQREALHIDASVVALPQLLAWTRQSEIKVIGLGIDAFLLINGNQRVQVEKGIVRDDAAGRLRPPDVRLEHRGRVDQPCTNLEIAETIDVALLDTLRLALDQARAAVLQLNAVAAGIG